MNQKQLPRPFIATSPNYPQQELFISSEVVAREAMTGPAEYWIMAIALILMIMNYRRFSPQFSYLGIIRHLTIKHHRTDISKDLPRRNRAVEKMGSRDN